MSDKFEKYPEGVPRGLGKKTKLLPPSLEGDTSKHLWESAERKSIACDGCSFSLSCWIEVGVVIGLTISSLDLEYCLLSWSLATGLLMPANLGAVMAMAPLLLLLPLDGLVSRWTTSLKLFESAWIKVVRGLQAAATATGVVAAAPCLFLDSSMLMRQFTFNTLSTTSVSYT